jgi:hypothetical protein
MALFIGFVLAGAFLAVQSKKATRLENRRMFESMQLKAPLYMRPFILLTLLGAVLAVALHVLTLNP